MKSPMHNYNTPDDSTSNYLEKCIGSAAMIGHLKAFIKEGQVPNGSPLSERLLCG